jgi:hypothetical protein
LTEPLQLTDDAQRLAGRYGDALLGGSIVLQFTGSPPSRGRHH